MSDAAETFPRQRARTRGFRLGAPHGFRIRSSDERTRVVFIRSSGGRVAAGDLWVADSAGRHTGRHADRHANRYKEQLVVSAADIGSSGQVPAAELARRERLREVTEGITAYSLDSSGSFAAFAVDGTVYRADIDAGSIRALTEGIAAVDPQISPDGRYVAYVADSRVFVVDVAAGTTTCVTPDHESTISWGIADFIAAEELERHRGMWWLPDSTALLVERVDEAEVDVRWIGDPAQPAREPVPHRYPAAGTANARVSLHRIDLDGVITELAWDYEAYCYLASVNVSVHGSVVVSVLSRDQQRQQILQLRGDSLDVVINREQLPWITVVESTPTMDQAGRLLEVLPIDGDFRLTREGQPLSPAGMNVEAIVDIGEGYVVVQAATEPTSRVIAKIHDDGPVELLSPETGWHAAVGQASILVRVSASLSQLGSTVQIIDDGEVFALTSRAETPSIHPRPMVTTVGQRELSTCLILPSHHEPGMVWPVICSPYGGPHAQRVVQVAQAYLTEQWLADQGFAVVVTDGRGTPGRGPDWEFAVHGDLAGPVLDDQVDALTDLAEREPALDISRVGIRGWSFGGYLAALAVLDRPDVFHAAVAGAPVTDWALYDTAYTERYLGDPREDDAAYARTTLLTRAPKLTRPLLLIHGLADDNVLAAHTLQMSSALLAAGRQHNVLPLSGVTHMTPQEVIAENLLLTEVDFFRSHLG